MKTKMIFTASALAFAFAGAQTLHADNLETATVLEQLDNMNDLSEAPAGPTDSSCTMATTRGICANKTISVEFKGCTVNSGKVALIGGWDESFSGTGAELCASPMVSGETITRTSKGVTATFASGETLMLDTLAAQAYDKTEIPATGIVVARINKDQSSVLINGLHLLFKDKAGIARKEHFVISSKPLLVSGSKKDGSLLISEGGIRIFNQLDKFTSDVNIDQLAWSDKTCCHPVNGVITQTMSGAKVGVQKLTFTPMCGTATLLDVDGKSSVINLAACK